MPDTIAAIATASAAAAVGIVRLSGAETRRVLAAEAPQPNDPPPA